MKTIYLVRLTFDDQGDLISTVCFVDEDDAKRYAKSVAGGVANAKTHIYEAELMGRNEWSPLPVLEESCV